MLWFYKINVVIALRGNDVEVQFISKTNIRYITVAKLETSHSSLCFYILPLKWPAVSPSYRFYCDKTCVP